MIRTLVVDDSATMRALIAAALRRDREIEVVGEAADPFEARAAIKALNPDVITLDIEMPGMNGLEFLERLMRLRPMPVVMVSSLTADGTEASVRALSLGAVECVAKPGPGGSFDELPMAVRVASAAQVRQIGTAAMPRPIPAGAGAEIIAIGASTGGVEALSTVLAGFPRNCPPTLITQHIRASFTRSLAARLDRLCAATVAEAEDGEPLRSGRIYLAPGGKSHLTVGGKAPGKLRCVLVEGPLANGHCPSIDGLFHSVAQHAGSRGIGVILSGMGRDGALGLLAIRQAGGRTLAQDADSSVVYGMPRAAVDVGAVQQQVPLRSMAARIMSVTLPLVPGTMAAGAC